MTGRRDRKKRHSGRTSNGPITSGSSVGRGTTRHRRWILRAIPSLIYQGSETPFLHPAAFVPRTRGGSVAPMDYHGELTESRLLGWKAKISIPDFS
ncbi:hypothetical protein AVEN_86983-1 [Araneus ventricosus]|uniref:Uncharacterized protein n=1 Tax=Araneus ventricosus TaxID=182803 RepID=A0A4Y2LCG3_ARAVE|nr:hypothetical protein AVEN_86983-1 [Araneus ventricosus]